jgi:hypothetical protein
MPYRNSYNSNIHNKLNQLYRKHIDNEDSINDNTMKDKHVIAGELEHLTTTGNNLQGGNHEEATLRDMGYEKTKDDDIKPIRKKRTIITETQLINGSGLSAGGMADGGLPIDTMGSGMSAGGMSAGGMSAGAIKTNAIIGHGLSAGAKKPRATRKKKIIDQPVVDKAPETGGDLKDVLDTAAGIAKTVAPFAPLLLGLGKDHVKRVDIVKKIMHEKGLKLIEASKFVKEHNLYTPKEKKPKEKKPKVMKGGTLLSLKSADFVGEVIPVQPIESGNVKPLKGRGMAKAKVK